MTIAYLDANAIIRFIESEDDGLLHLFKQAAASVIRLVTSEFTLAEVLVVPLKAGNKQLVRIYEDLMTEGALLDVRPVGRDVLRRSADIRANLGNKGPDAIHVATALAADCAYFVSSDRRLKLPGSMTQIPIDRVRDLDRRA